MTRKSPFIYLLTPPPCAMTSLIFKTSRLQPLPSLFRHWKKNHKLIKRTLYVFQSCQISYSPSQDILANPPISPSILRTFSYSNSCVSHNQPRSFLDKPYLNVGLQISCRLGILHRTKSFLGTPELPSTNKAFIHSLMEYCSPLWDGSPASHLAQLDTVETKTFKTDVLHLRSSQI